MGCSGTAAAEGTPQDTITRPQGPPDLNLALAHHKAMATDHFIFKKKEKKKVPKGQHIHTLVPAEQILYSNTVLT